LRVLEITQRITLFRKAANDAARFDVTAGQAEGSTSSTRRSRNTVAAAKRAALNAKRRKAHKARCR
jgi:hypothetical protein